MLLLIDCDDPVFRTFLFATIGVIWLLALLVVIVAAKPDVAIGSAFLKALGILVVLDIAGTIMTILAWRLSLSSGTAA